MQKFSHRRSLQKLSMPFFTYRDKEESQARSNAHARLGSLILSPGFFGAERRRPPRWCTVRSKIVLYIIIFSFFFSMAFVFSYETKMIYGAAPWPTPFLFSSSSIHYNHGFVVRIIIICGFVYLFLETDVIASLCVVINMIFFYI